MGDTKRCGMCQKVKPVEEFFRRARSKDGRQSRCKVCTGSYKKDWRAQNPEQESATVAAWREANKEAIQVRSARYRKANKKRLQERDTEWRKANPEKMKGYYFKHKYGITWERYLEMLAAQGGKCAVCRHPCSTHGRLSVDHCHTFGTVRGLLCQRCNSALGLMEDDPARLRAAADYLERMDEPEESHA